jgi:hypothetical protein
MSDPSKYGVILIANYQTNHEWSDKAKGAMIGMRMAGMSQRAVARVLGTEHNIDASDHVRLFIFLSFFLHSFPLFLSLLF